MIIIRAIYVNNEHSTIYKNLKPKMMKQKIFAMFAAAMLLLGTAGCTNEDNPSPIDIDALEQSIVGVWWDQYEYADVTETGMSFSRVLLAVKADADHTGCIYLGVYDETSDEPLAIYGGPKDAAFTWQVRTDGTIVLGDPETGETYPLAPALTRGSSYGSNMTNTSNTNMSYSNGSVTVTNGNQSNTLNKANAEQTATIEQKLSTGVNSNVDLESGGKTPNDFGSGDIR